ncbi:hypothetical protein PIB30_097967 [Stylosanthes scabra]|uniref:Putative plant transposon protein domain-containing protein n=1 Tax=Stylosanthes scabra TaxID=79078 RepID=A0ABU6RWU3_9FABA|nr:hypothetical protein [Stylosanthes scabra]
MPHKSRKRNASDAPSSSQRPNTPPEATFDATRFKSLAHERHYEEMVQFRMPILEVPFSLKKNEFKHIKDEITRRGWDLLCNTPQKKMGIMLLREFYANARMTRRDKQSNPHYMTSVRGKVNDFSPESIKVILQLPDMDDNEQSYEARRKADDQRLNGVLRDIGEPFAQWKLDNKRKPSQIKRRELNPTASGWFDFVRRSLIPSSNNSEVTVERVVLVHSIIEGLDIKAELLITENISAAAESKDQAKRLPFPSIIYRLLYANGIKKIDRDKLIPIERPITTESMTKNKYLEIQQEIQQQFPQQPPQVQKEQNQHDQTLPQQFNWQELNQQFQEMRVDQIQELKKSQDKHHKEFLAHKKELQKQYQKDREEYVTITNHEIEFRKRTDLKMDYLCWGLQQTNPHLALIPSQDIPAFCLSNMEKGKGKFEGALRPILVGGSSSKGKGVEDVDHSKKKTWEARDDGDSDEE